MATIAELLASSLDALKGVELPSKIDTNNPYNLNLFYTMEVLS
ncbi:hypothetical protein [Bacteroides sp.]